jgi:HSP20 family protein
MSPRNIRSLFRRRTEMPLRTDVYEDGAMLAVEIELPGVRPEQIEITVDPLVLGIRGRSTEMVADRRYRRRERSAGPFQRDIPLPVPVRREGAEATLCDGVLQVRLAMEKEEIDYDVLRRVPIGGGVAVCSGAFVSVGGD